ncbi:MAG: hypothetical protein ACTTJS_05785 [Wolinella sp.]
MVINTGTPRSVMGHFVSGSLAALLISSASNYRRVKNGELDIQKAGIDTLKRTLQGGVVAASAISAANHIGKNNGYFQALASLSVGMASVYAIERGAELIESNKTKKITHKGE